MYRLTQVVHLLPFNQPDSSVEPFFNSVVQQLGIPDIFSLQMCGAGLSTSSTADPAGGSLVSSQQGQLGEESDKINPSNNVCLLWFLEGKMYKQSLFIIYNVILY